MVRIMVRRLVHKPGHGSDLELKRWSHWDLLIIGYFLEKKNYYSPVQKVFIISNQIPKAINSNHYQHSNRYSSFILKILSIFRNFQKFYVQTYVESMITVKFKSGYIDFQSITRDDRRVYRGSWISILLPENELGI